MSDLKSQATNAETALVTIGLVSTEKLAEELRRRGCEVKEPEKPRFEAVSVQAGWLVGSSVWREDRACFYGLNAEQEAKAYAVLLNEVPAMELERLQAEYRALLGNQQMLTHELERLRSENERMREGLEAIADGDAMHFLALRGFDVDSGSHYLVRATALVALGRWEEAEELLR